MICNHAFCSIEAQISTHAIMSIIIFKIKLYIYVHSRGTYLHSIETVVDFIYKKIKIIIDMQT